jgi:hypothetical protein
MLLFGNTYCLVFANNMATEQESSYHHVYGTPTEDSERRTTENVQHNSATSFRSSIGPLKKRKITAVPNTTDILRNTSCAKVVSDTSPCQGRDGTGRNNDTECHIGCTREAFTSIDRPAATTVSSGSVASEATRTPPVPHTSTRASPLAPAPTSNERTIEGMRVFDQEVDESVKDRFREVQEQLEPSLIIFLHKTRVEFRPLALQLLVLGFTEDAARPWIVVYCPKEAKRKVKKFFRKDITKTICYGGSRSCRIKFDVIVGGSIKPSGSDTPDEVLVEKVVPEIFEVWTPQIKVTQSGVACYATMGGFVCTINPHGRSFYGLTVGHILPTDRMYHKHTRAKCENDEEDESGEDKFDNVQEDSASDSDSNESSCPDHDNCSLNTRSIPNPQTFVGSHNELLEKDVHGRYDREWLSLGYMSTASYSDRARDRDWALIEPAGMNDRQTDDPREVPSRSFIPARPTKGQNAVLCNKSKLSCTISVLSARAILPSGRKFVDLNVIQASSDQGA